MSDSFSHLGAIGLILLILTPVAMAETPTGRRQLPDYEADVYGPLPFPEEVTGFIEHEIAYLLERQKENGSWDSAQPQGNGRTSMEAGGTVDNITLTSMCAYSLRGHMETSPKQIEDAVSRALKWVTYMIGSGKLRNNVQDSPWWYTYTLRFLINEYPRIKDEETKGLVRDTCAFIVGELRDIQQGTHGQKSVPFYWKKYASLGMVVEDTKDGGRAVVTSCDPTSPAYKAGIRKGDRLIAVNDLPVASTLRYYMAERDWLDGDTVAFKVVRSGQMEEIRVSVPPQYPGTLGVQLEDRQGGAAVTGFAFLSNPTNAPLQVGDRLLKIDDTPISRQADVDRVCLFAGHMVRLLVKRGDRSLTFDYICAPVPAADFGVKLSQRMDQSTTVGLKIESFAQSSCLSAAGFKPNDRLLRVDGTLILNVRHFEQVERSIWGGKRVRVVYLDGGSGQRKEVDVTTGSMPDVQWLKGYHGLSLSKDGATVQSVDYGSPAHKAGIQQGDRIAAVNGTATDGRGRAEAVLASIPCGVNVVLTVVRNDQRKEMSFTTRRSSESIWWSKSEPAGGGWGYLVKVKGSTTFLTADTLRELLKARSIMKLDVPDEMISRAFMMLTTLRNKQPNSNVESYRYDANGSFWGEKDIRADVGRLPSAELACVMYSDSGLENGGFSRNQTHLGKALGEWLKHRGILDLVKFPKGHGKLSIAPWFWMYSYRTTLEAADYLKGNDELKEQVRRTALKAFFKHMEFRFEKKLGRVGWIIGGDLDKELHDSCQLLDGLATMKHIYMPRLKMTFPLLKDVLEKFNATKYGEAYDLVAQLQHGDAAGVTDVTAGIKLIMEQVADRFASRLAEVKKIHSENPYDGLYHLEQMKTHFTGYPDVGQLDRLEQEWKRTIKPTP